MIGVIAKQELKALTRERILFFLLAVFVLMISVTSFLGWEASVTTNSIYQASIHFLRLTGVSPLPLNPLANIPALSTFRNLIVYMFLIGSLLGIVVGYHSVMRERKSGTLSLQFSRPISDRQFLVGKLVGVATAILIIIFFSGLISVAFSFFLPTQHLATPDVWRLGLFFGWSFFYLLLFVLVGFTSALTIRNESLALFLPVILWVGICFVIPELTSGQTPTALLNPVKIDQSAPSSPFFQRTGRILNPISYGWQYTMLSGDLLPSPFDAVQPVGQVIRRHIGFIALLFVSLAACFALSARGLQNLRRRGDMAHV